MTMKVLNMIVCFVHFTGFVLKTTVFVQNLTIFVKFECICPMYRIYHEYPGICREYGLICPVFIINITILNEPDET